ncbi:MAG TPA: DEAD/DEAH box helicase family protein [Trichocoleus sp.]
MAPPTLRPYQVELINDLYRKLNEGYKKVAVIAGTGAGKTVISGQICAHAESAGKRLLFLVHLDVLVGQTYEKMKAFGLHCGFIKAGWGEDPSAPVQIASVQTMAKRHWWKDWSADVVFYDEGHITLFSQVGQEVLRRFPNAVHLVMTATPDRLGREQLGDYLETLVASPVPNELQAMGFLAKMRYFAMPPDGMADVEGLKIVQGDYEEAGLKRACDRPQLINKIVEEWRRLCPGKRTIAFCVDLEHARHVAATFQEAGIPSETVEGGTSIKQRQAMYQRLRSGETLVLTSCNVISIGFDEPSVEVGLLLRPTQSSALHFQQVGRVMRISPQTGKQYGIILDQAGNLERLGFPEDINGYELAVSTKSSKAGGGAPSKVCPSCGKQVYSFISKCDCGFTWSVDQILKLEDMVEIYSREQAHKITDTDVLIGIFHGYRRKVYADDKLPALAEQVFFEHCGRSPSQFWYFGSIFGREPSPEQMLAFYDYLVRCFRRTGKTESWLITEFEKEFGAGSYQQLMSLRYAMRGA